MRSTFALVLALPSAEPFAFVLDEDVPFAVVLPVALVLVPVRDAVVPVRPRVVVRPAVADGVHGVACAPVCTPDDVVVPEVPVRVPWLDRVEGVEVDGDDVLPLDCATAGTASARLNATPPVHVIHLLLM